MKIKIYALIVLIACLTLLQPQIAFSASALQTNVILPSSGVIQQNPTGTYSYIISVSGSNYQMKNGTTRQIVFQSTNSSKVFSNVVGNCSVGSSIDVESGVYAVNTMWLVNGINNITVNFENGAKLVAGNNLNTAVLVLYNSDNCIIDGVEIDGNANQQIEGSGFTWNGLFMEADGIFVSGNNDRVQNAVVYNCRMVGVDIFAITGTVNNSGVTNSLIYDCGWNGINAGGSWYTSFNCYAINNEVYGCGDVGINSNGNNGLIQGNYVHDMNGTTGDGNTHSGILNEGGNYTVITLNTVRNAAIAIGIAGQNYPCPPANYGTVSYNEITNCTSSGVVVFGGANSGPNAYGTWAVGNIVAYNTISHLIGASTHGITLIATSNNTVIGNIVSYCTWSGFYGVSAHNNTIILNSFFDNTVHGMDLTNCGNNYISENQIYGQLDWGISFASPSPNTVIINNNIHNNGYGSFSTDQIPNPALINNTGYNPLGYISTKFIHNATGLNYIVDGSNGGGNSSIWVSGTTYTNSGSPKDLIISGGIVTAIVFNGQTLYTSATNCTITLQPSDTFSITFSSAPTIKVFGQ